jgi:hypothetical protein
MICLKCGHPAEQQGKMYVCRECNFTWTLNINGKSYCWYSRLESARVIPNGTLLIASGDEIK